MKRLLNYIGLTAILAQVLLVLLSWLLSAMQVQDVRSLLSAEGLRWYASHFSGMLLTPLLSWLLVGAMAFGCLSQSGVVAGLSRKPEGYRQRIALRATVILAIVFVGVVLLLVAVPHAVLLSATGSLWPSPFSSALVPILLTGIIMLSAVYGLVGGRFSRIDDLFQSFIAGVASWSPVFFLYVLIIQFYESLRYVFL